MFEEEKNEMADPQNEQSLPQYWEMGLIQDLVWQE